MTKLGKIMAFSAEESPAITNCSKPDRRDPNRMSRLSIRNNGIDLLLGIGIFVSLVVAGILVAVAMKLPQGMTGTKCRVEGTNIVDSQECPSCPGYVKPEGDQALWGLVKGEDWAFSPLAEKTRVRRQIRRMGRQDGPHHDGPRHDGHHDGPHHDGPHHDGPHHDGHHDGPHHDGPHHDGPHHDGPHHDGPHHDGLHHDGPHRDDSSGDGGPGQRPGRRPGFDREHPPSWDQVGQPSGARIATPIRESSSEDSLLDSHEGPGDNPGQLHRWLEEMFSGFAAGSGSEESSGRGERPGSHSRSEEESDESYPDETNEAWEDSDERVGFRASNSRSDDVTVECDFGEGDSDEQEQLQGSSSESGPDAGEMDGEEAEEVLEDPRPGDLTGPVAGPAGEEPSPGDLTGPMAGASMHTGEERCSTSSCARVLARYNLNTADPDGAGFGLLRHNESTATSYPTCSYSSCDQSNQENEQNVNEWLAGYVAKQETGEEFDCYYNPEEPEKVYVGKVYSETEVVNAVLWPALFTVVCLLALVGRRIYFKCIKKQTAPREMPYTVSAPQTKPDQTQDPEKNPTQLGAEAGSQAAGPVAAAPPLELKAPPEYSEIVEASGGRPVAFILPPTYSEANLHKAAKEPLPPCDA